MKLTRKLGPTVVAAAVFDHGAAPPGVSDRIFRFEYIAEIVRQNDLTAFAYQSVDVPEQLTRMQAVARCAPRDLPAVIMDTGPAAAVGALLEMWRDADADLPPLAEAKALRARLGTSAR